MCAFLCDPVSEEEGVNIDMETKRCFMLSTYPLGLWHGGSLMLEVMGSTCIRPHGVRLEVAWMVARDYRAGERDHHVHCRSSKPSAVQ